MQQNRAYVAPDTNFLLHGRPLAEITPAMVGLGGPFTWLFVRTVVKELDDKTHHANARIKRRATIAMRALEAAAAGQAGDLSLVRYNPRPPLDYADMGFDPHDADDRIRAEIVRFKQTNPDSDVRLLTLDTGMRLHARDHNIDLAVPAVELQVAEEEDPTERDLRNARRELAAFQAAQPDVRATFEQGSVEIEVAVYPPISDTSLQAIVDTVTAPDDESLLPPMFLGAMWRKSPDYADRLEAYAAKLREIIPSLWRSMGSVITLSLALTNDGDVEADDVKVDLALPDVVCPLKQRPEKVSIPLKPEPYVHMGSQTAAWRLGALLKNHRNTVIPSLLTREYRAPAESGPTLYGDGAVGYWQRAIRQRRTIVLEPLVIDVENGPAAFGILYEIRGTNMIGVRRGTLVVRTPTVSVDDAVDHVVMALRFTGDDHNT